MSNSTDGRPAPVRAPWFLAPEAAAQRRLRLIPSPPPEPVTPVPDPITRRDLPGSVWELARDAVSAVCGVVAAPAVRVWPLPSTGEAAAYSPGLRQASTVSRSQP